MNQYPYGNQPNQYNPNDQTVPNYQYVPGQYYNAAPPPPPKFSRSKRAWRWYRGQKKRTQWGLGCGVLIAAMFLCMCSSAIAAPTASQTANNPTPTATSAQQVAAVATDTPTPPPTPTPTPTPVPTKAPTQPPAPPNPCPNAPGGNPWCYSFAPGSLIYSPPGNFCAYFACISSFWNGSGYVEECNDGDYSKSGGRSGSCSHHGGNMRPLYSH